MSSSNLFRRSFTQRDRVGKSSRPTKRSFSEKEKKRILAKLNSPLPAVPVEVTSPPLTSGIVKIAVGEGPPRLFAAHEDVLRHSPFFAAVVQDLAFVTPKARVIHLPDEVPEVFSCVLEYLYKGDYHPRLGKDERGEWALEGRSEDLPQKNGRGNGAESTIFHPGVRDKILRDTLVYCAAGRYGLDELQRLALRKQGLQEYIEIGVILRSARYAYENSPEQDSRLRAHYLAMLIRCRNKFKHSGTLQMEMETGGKLFFDLFVAMCNHMDDLVNLNAQLAASLENAVGSPKWNPMSPPMRSPYTI